MPAKVADRQMKPNTDPFAYGQPAIHRLRKQTCNLIAGRSHLPDPGDELRCWPVVGHKFCHWRQQFFNAWKTKSRKFPDRDPLKRRPTSVPRQ
jgi:hypothetical protein